MAEQECECGPADMGPAGMGVSSEIEFCPKHAAVDELIAALEFLLPVVPDNRLTREAKKHAQDAIRKAKPKP